MSLQPGFLDEFAKVTSTFVETGSHRGDGVQAALDAGYEMVFSTDIEPFAYGWCSHRFEGRRDRVGLFLMDSREFLWKILQYGVHGPTTFWLDAHWCGGNGELEGKDTTQPGDCPLLQELELIVADARNNVILIDDVRLFGTELPELAQVEELLARGRYRSRRADSLDFKDDILIAEKI